MLGWFNVTEQRAGRRGKVQRSLGVHMCLHACGQGSQIHSMSQGLNIISIPGSCRGSPKTMDN